MTIRTLQLYILALLTVSCIYCSNAIAHSFELPPDEQVMLTGNGLSTQVLTCDVEHNDIDNDWLMNFISADNTSIINNLIMPQGTISSVCFPVNHKKSIRVELGAGAKLGITNTSSELVRLSCVQVR